MTMGARRCRFARGSVNDNTTFPARDDALDFHDREGLALRTGPLRAGRVGAGGSPAARARPLVSRGAAGPDRRAAAPPRDAARAGPTHRVEDGARRVARTQPGARARQRAG